MGGPPILIPSDENGTAIHKFLDAFEYVHGNATGDPQYFGYLHDSGTYVITKVAGPGTAAEHITFYMGRDGGAALTLLWGDGTGPASLDYVEYDALYP